MVPLPRKPRAVGNFKLPAWPAGKSAEILFREEGGEIHIHLHTRASEEKGQNGSTVTTPMALASRSSKGMQIVPNERWLLSGFDMALSITHALSPLKDNQELTPELRELLCAVI